MYAVANFRKCNEIGKKGEQEVFAALSKLFRAAHKIENGKKGQDAGIDGYLTIGPLGIITVQVKTCQRIHETGNMWFDLLEGNPGKKKLGWPYVTTALIVAYYDWIQKQCWVFDTMDLKRHITSYARRYKHRTIMNEGIYEEFPIIGIAVPLAVIKKDMEPRLYIFKEDYGT